MTRHVAVLSTLYVTWGALFAIVALAGFALAAGAAAIAGFSPSARVSPEMAARLTALTIGLVSFIALVWGGLHLWIGRALQRHRPSARLMALGMAVGNMALIPFGTALGAYAGWVLLSEEGREIFEGVKG